MFLKRSSDHKKVDILVSDVAFYEFAGISLYEYMINEIKEEKVWTMLQHQLSLKGIALVIKYETWKYWLDQLKERLQNEPRKPLVLFHKENMKTIWDACKTNLKNDITALYGTPVCKELLAYLEVPQELLDVFPFMKTKKLKKEPITFLELVAKKLKTDQRSVVALYPSIADKKYDLSTWNEKSAKIYAWIDEQKFDPEKMLTSIRSNFKQYCQVKEKKRKRDVLNPEEADSALCLRVPLLKK